MKIKIILLLTLLAAIGLGDGSGRETPPRGPVQRGGQIHRKRRDPDGRQERIQLRDARGRFHAQALRAAPDGRQVQLVRRRAARAGRSGQRSEQRLRDSLRHSRHLGPGVQQADVQPDAERGQERRRAAAAGVGRRESEAIRFVSASASSRRRSARPIWSRWAKRFSPCCPPR